MVVDVTQLRCVAWSLHSIFHHLDLQHSTMADKQVKSPTSPRRSQSPTREAKRKEENVGQVASPSKNLGAEKLGQQRVGQESDIAKQKQESPFRGEQKREEKPRQ